MVIDNVLLACILSVSAVSESLDLGTQIHSAALQIGCESDICVREALMDMYAKCSTMEGNVHNGFSVEALRNFYQMQKEGVNPDLVACISVLMGCIDMKAIDHGKQIHAYTINLKIGLENDKFVGTALIDMYSKCGSIENSVSYFMGTSKSDIVLWNALLSSHAHHGNGLEVLKAFNEMKNYGVKPDEVTFLAVLSGCSHGNLVDRAVHYFFMVAGFY
ncbi:pentatricopeptide repeat-containing protein At4g38010-like [Tasmannia lanceolata]|uniref:pentatricopeptide repeat-containing protein At4g38010-like n=1 Tax=Tasmannia lanceolata TaxID=3420 RepID=UPI004064A66C